MAVCQSLASCPDVDVVAMLSVFYHCGLLSQRHWGHVETVHGGEGQGFRVLEFREIKFVAAFCCHIQRVGLSACGRWLCSSVRPVS